MSSQAPRMAQVAHQRWPSERGESSGTPEGGEPDLPVAPRACGCMRIQQCRLVRTSSYIMEVVRS